MVRRKRVRSAPPSCPVWRCCDPNNERCHTPRGPLCRAGELAGRTGAGRGAASWVRPPRPCCKPLELENPLGEIKSDGAHLIHPSLLELSSTNSLRHTAATDGGHT